MARRRRQFGIEDFFELLTAAPSWVGPLLAMVALVVLGLLASAASGQPRSGVDNCRTCGAAMIRRTARRGEYAGSQFCGCSRYRMDFRRVDA